MREIPVKEGKAHNMRITIHRGTKEIGGTCVEIIADNGKILWIDLGMPLTDKAPNVEYANYKVDSLLISHPHQDHYGLMEFVGANVPIYLGELTLDLINSTRLFRGLKPQTGNFQIIKPWQQFIIEGTFEITPFLTDHSSPEAYAFLIEVDGKRIFYSGDFRGSGRKNKVFNQLIANPPSKIDILLIEGTMIDRKTHAYLNERSVENAIFEIIKIQQNLTFIVSSSQNIDRFVSVFRACKRSNKYLIIDIYTAWILDVVRKQSPGTPSLEWNEIKVFVDPRQLNIIKDNEFDNFRRKVLVNKIDNDIFNDPSKYVLFVRCPNLKLVNKLKHRGTINLIYSQWEGYLKAEKLDKNSTIIDKIKKDEEINFQTIHTSGHALTSDLIKLAKAINAQTVVPIHTDSPERFQSEFNKAGLYNVSLWHDGNEYLL